MTPRLFPIKRAAPSFFERARINQDLAEAREAERNDPLVLAVARSRAASAAVATVRQDARREWDALNVPVDLGLPAQVHPQVRDVIMRTLAEHGVTDLSAPITPTKSVDEIAGDLLVEARRAEHEADAEVARLESAMAEPVMPITAPVKGKLTK